jgi:glycosyltransferase involved in cell wall biosynthesis
MQHKHDRHPVEPERRILIVVPTYNEEGNIAPLTAALETALAATRYTYDLLFADDLSTDGTRKKIAAYQKKRLGVYLSSGRRAGLGKAYIRALTAGLRLGEYWAYVTLDADLSHDPNYIPQMLATLEDGADLVLGSRYVAGGGSGSDYSKFRRLLGAATRVRDRTAGFRAIRGASLAALPLNRFAASGYFFAFEFIHACETEGLRITEVPIIFQARKHGKSKLRLRDIAEYLRYSYRLGSISGFKKIVDFGALYLLFLAVGITQLDPDFGWHLTTGNYVLSHWLPTHDIYSYTARSFAWIDHEWGNDVITVILYRLGGYPLTTAFFAALWSGAVYLAGSGRARLLTLLAAGFAVTTYTGTRPLAWTVFLFSLVLAILRSPSHRRRWALPLTFILWANLHAGFIAGLALIGYYLILERRRSTLLLLIACFTATLINAYGANIYTEITRTIGDPAIHKRIQEWLPFYINATSWTFISLWLAGLILHRPLLHIGPGRTTSSTGSASARS